MIFLQTDFVHRGFETSADTVYGLLVAGAVLVIIALTSAVVYLFRLFQKQSEQAYVALNATAERLERLEKILTNES